MMSNNRVFISMVNMSDSKTQVADINVKYKKKNKGFIKENAYESKIIRKRVRSMGMRKPYDIVE